MPREVDVAERGRAVRDATLEVIREHGVTGVTIRRVASYVGGSTAVVTHYVATRDDLLAMAVGGALDERRATAARLMADADDPLWALIEWSVSDDADLVWPTLVAAAAADIDPVVTELVTSFERWWADLVVDLVVGRVIGGVTNEEAVDAIGVVVDGLILGVDAADSTIDERLRVARVLIEPLLAR